MNDYYVAILPYPHSPEYPEEETEEEAVIEEETEISLTKKEEEIDVSIGQSYNSYKKFVWVRCIDKYIRKRTERNY